MKNVSPQKRREEIEISNYEFGIKNVNQHAAVFPIPNFYFIITLCVLCDTAVNS
jgi:hypothetical protein